MDFENKKLMIDDRLESYQSFYDHEWARSFSQLVSGTMLDPPALDLCKDWKGAANAGRLPWHVVHSLKDFYYGYLQPGDSSFQRLTKGLLVWLQDRTRHSFNLTKQKELIGIVNKVSQEVQEGITKAPPVLDLDEIWSEFLSITEFTLSLWSLQKLCYCAVYYAYENFLRMCVSIGQDRPEYRPRTDELMRDLRALFGIPIGDACLSDEGVVLARQVRNALAHNGGRATTEIEANRGELSILDGDIQIMPLDVRKLYTLLKGQVTAIAEKSRSMAAFRV